MTRPTSGQPVGTIAVLPFKPLVVENRDEALELCIADTLITKLGGAGEVALRPVSSVRRYARLTASVITVFIQAGRFAEGPQYANRVTLEMVSPSDNTLELLRHAGPSIRPPPVPAPPAGAGL